MSEKEVPRQFTREVAKNERSANIIKFDNGLKPCPFCGGQAAFEEVNNAGYVAWSVGCQNNEVDCIAYQMLATYSRKAEALDAWNKRYDRS